MNRQKPGALPVFAGTETSKNDHATTTIFQDFCEETTAHAFLRIGDSGRKWGARAFWLFVLLGFTGIFAEQFGELVKKYLRYDTNVNIYVATESSLPFPTVSICNLNPFQSGRLKNGSTIYQYSDLIKQAIALDYTTELKGICNQRNNPIVQLFCHDVEVTNTTDSGQQQTDSIQQQTTVGSQGQGQPGSGQLQGQQKPNVISISMLALEDKAARDIGMLAYQNLNSSKEAWQPEDNLIQDCQFNLETCLKPEDGDKYSNSWPNPWYGVCRSVNFYGKWQSIRPGPMYGLTLQLNVDRDQYLPSTVMVGVRVSVDQPWRQPFPEINGVFAPVGAATAISIAVVETNRMGPPYGKCMEESDNFNHSDKNFYNTYYTLNGCVNTCLQKQIMEKCGCWYFAYPQPPENLFKQYKLCNSSTWTMTCVKREEKNKENCSCQPRCKDLDYKLTISHSLWPSSARCPPGVQNCISGSDAAEYASRNQLKLQIFFESLNKYTYTETEAYGYVSLISDFGGQLGLWIGASFCTLFEVLSLILSLTMACCGQNRHSIEKRSSDNPTERKRESDATEIAKSSMTNMPQNAVYPTTNKIYGNKLVW